MDCSLPGFSDHGIFQARVLEWVAISFSRGSSWPRDRTRVSRILADALPSEPPGKPCLYMFSRKLFSYIWVFFALWVSCKVTLGKDCWKEVKWKRWSIKRWRMLSRHSLSNLGVTYMWLYLGRKKELGSVVTWAWFLSNYLSVWKCSS